MAFFHREDGSILICNSVIIQFIYEPLIKIYMIEICSDKE
jgi:hypothetical protein